MGHLNPHTCPSMAQLGRRNWQTMLGISAKACYLGARVGKARPSRWHAAPAVTQKRPTLTEAQTLAGICRASSGNGTSSTADTGAVAVENLVIVGSGPAGYTAAIYAARANLKPVVFEGYQSGRGGQLMTTTEVENFPGFPEGVTGPDLMDRMRKQAERWGAELFTEDVVEIDLQKRPFSIKGTENEFFTHSLIMATGATAKRLGLPSENELWGKGISACAICDGASPLFKQQEVAVVGGGDSAVEEAVYLTKYARQVHLLVRGNQLRASKTMVDRATDHKAVQLRLNTVVEDAYGSNTLDGVHLKDTATGKKESLPVKGLFYGIGHQPNSQLLAGQVELDEVGYVKVRSPGVATSVEGVFAAGDLHDAEWRQAVTAAGSGCMAALSAERYLTANGLAIEFHQKADAQQAKVEAEEAKVDPAEIYDVKNDKHKGQYALRKLYHESDRLIAVLYTSPTCGPCRTLKPIFHAVLDEFAGKLHYVEIDIDEDPEIAEAAGVNGTPTVQFFKTKQRLMHLPGVKMKTEYRSLIGSNL